MIGRREVIAIALARPVVEPPPTQTSRSMPCSAAAARAFSAVSMGTCITTSWCQSATSMSAATVRAIGVSKSEAITITRPRAEAGYFRGEVRGGCAGAEEDTLAQGHMVKSQAHCSGFLYFEVRTWWPRRRHSDAAAT